MPTTVKISSDVGHGLTTVDGFVGRAALYDLWVAIHDGIGTTASPILERLEVAIGSPRWAGYWSGLVRSIMTFYIDPLLIPVGSVIQSAKFCGWGILKNDTHGCKPQIAIYQSYPLNDNNLVNLDYQRLYNTLLSNIINYDDFSVQQLSPVIFNNFTLNPIGLALIVPNQICRLGLREAKYDAPNIEPPRYANTIMRFRIASVEYSAGAQDPYLEVTFEAPPVKDKTPARVLSPARVLTPARTLSAVRNLADP